MGVWWAGAAAAGKRCAQTGAPPPHPHCRQARKGEAESTPEDILSMVKAQCAPQHRLILFLQQSSVEWASSLWMHVLQVGGGAAAVGLQR